MSTKLKSQKKPLHNAKSANHAAYLELFRSFPIRPIRSEKELDDAIAIAQGLVCRKKPLVREEQDYLEILSNEIARYEADTYPMPNVSDSAMLRHLLDAHDATLSEAAKATNIAVSTLSAVMHGKRKLNLEHIRKLADYFGIEPSVFVD